MSGRVKIVVMAFLAACTLSGVFADAAWSASGWTAYLTIESSGIVTPFNTAPHALGGRSLSVLTRLRSRSRLTARPLM